jgi:hypothetical protein
MNTINFIGDWGIPGIMSDLGVDYSKSPYHRIGFEIDDAGIEALVQHHADRVFRARRWYEDGKLTWETLLLRFPKDAYLVAWGGGRNYAELFAPSAAQVLKLHTRVRKLLEKDKPTGQPSFYMLRQDCGEFSADPIENLPEAVTDDFLKLCYGEDIMDWVTQFGEKTLSRPGGLTIFDGPPGTGKTSLVTQMIRRLEKTHVFYSLSASQNRALSDPDFVPFWQKQNVRHGDNVKVIVMEDAERLLWRRQGDNREAVSTILNIADGLLGRMLKLHLVCSVNATIDELDPAVLRPGRLMNHRRFNRLNCESARRIAAARELAFQAREGVESYSLAEVLNPGFHEPARTKPTIGFNVIAGN